MAPGRMKVISGRQRVNGRIPSDMESRSQDELIAAITEELKKKSDARTIGPQTTRFYLDRLARIRAWVLQLDILCGGRLFPTHSAIEVGARRAAKLLSIYTTLFDLEQEAIEGLISCVGGWELITLEAYLKTIRESGTTCGPLEQELIHRIAERIRRRDSSTKF